PRPRDRADRPPVDAPGDARAAPPLEPDRSRLPPGRLRGDDRLAPRRRLRAGPRPRRARRDVGPRVGRPPPPPPPPPPRRPRRRPRLAAAPPVPRPARERALRARLARPERDVAWQPFPRRARRNAHAARPRTRARRPSARGSSGERSGFR